MVTRPPPNREMRVRFLRLVPVHAAEAFTVMRPFRKRVNEVQVLVAAPLRLISIYILPLEGKFNVEINLYFALRGKSNVENNQPD